MGTDHTHLRNRLLIGCSWQVRRFALNLGANQYTYTAYSAKVCFMVAMASGNITASVNKGRLAGTMSSLLLLYVYGTY